MLAVVLALMLGAAACSAPAAPEGEAHQAMPATAKNKPALGLMTSLPLYWPLGADLAALASGSQTSPWQRTAMEREYSLVPLDTLSPISSLSGEDGDIDPLARLDRIAVIQPRGLSPADNVALDRWVRSGGQLLIMLDPLLTGEYKLPLGDPRRPNASALIPPVIARWGLSQQFDPDVTRLREIATPHGAIPVLMGSDLRIAGDAAGNNGCRLHESGLAARCARIGEGQVTYIGDASVFEHGELAGDDHEAIGALLAYAFD
ncbi:hypothetical protein [Qipengyuania nanhaisediminis]|uniref:hypothetical protein n=1 Tax=Qipengyuania nanhaisediminis TaxID=604088 RepID=UPI0038B3F12F